VGNETIVKIQDITAIPTAEIIYDLITCWDSYLEYKDDPEVNEMMPLLLAAAAARLLTYIRTIRFITVGLITTNVVWILNALGAFQ
tara:strand:- start:166 stop:423 length:258 start_codon:yes stop_codon:yes gene_type:complete